MRVPMLAIHLNRTINSEGFNPNKQAELTPILATAARLAVNAPAATNGASPDKPAAADGNNAASNGSGDFAQSTAHHHPALLQALAQEAGCAAEDIVDLELNVCDTQPGQLGGLADEFVFVGRLDNLAMSWCSMQARCCPRAFALHI